MKTWEKSGRKEEDLRKNFDEIDELIKTGRGKSKKVKKKEATNHQVSDVAMILFRILKKSCLPLQKNSPLETLGA